MKSKNQYLYLIGAGLGYFFILKPILEKLGILKSSQEIQQEKIIWVNQLPKTRSGKIMRRLLKKICLNELDTLGDTSSLADQSVIEEIITSYQAQK